MLLMFNLLLVVLSIFVGCSAKGTNGGSSGANETGGNNKDSLIWLFSPNGQLREDAPAGSLVQFDGPMRISNRISQSKTVYLRISEPFLMRQHFNITSGVNSPTSTQSLSSVFAAGQPFQIILIRPFSSLYQFPATDNNNANNNDVFTLTVEAQLLPTTTIAAEKEDTVIVENDGGNKKQHGNEKNGNVMRLLQVEHRMLRIKLVGGRNDEDDNNLIGRSVDADAKQQHGIKNNNLKVGETTTTNVGSREGGGKGRPQRRLEIIRDAQDCAIYRVQNLPRIVSASTTTNKNDEQKPFLNFQLFGPMANQFKILSTPMNVTLPQTTKEEMELRYLSGGLSTSACPPADLLVIDENGIDQQPAISVLVTLRGPFGNNGHEVWHLYANAQPTNGTNKTAASVGQTAISSTNSATDETAAKLLPRFDKNDFRIKLHHPFNPSLLQLHLLPYVVVVAAANNTMTLPAAAKTSIISFGLEETTDGGGAKFGECISVHPRTGMVFIKSVDKLMGLFKFNKNNPLQFAVKLLANGVVVDRANISLDVAVIDGSGKQKEDVIGGGVMEGGNKDDGQQMMAPRVRFERPIYAFAVDPYNMLQHASNQQQQAVTIIGDLGIITTPNGGDHSSAVNDDGNVHFVVSEGGNGLFSFNNNNNAESTAKGSGKNTLMFHGTMGQFARNYTLKVLLVNAHSGFIDTAIVHVLIAGIGSATPIFPNVFQQIIVPKFVQEEEKTFGKGKRVSAPKTLFTLSAEDPDPDAHLVYALENAHCLDTAGEEMPDCIKAFALSSSNANDVNGQQWVLSLIGGNGTHHAMAEALVNLSATDQAHPLERKAHTLVLLKFARQEQTFMGTNSNSTNLHFKFDNNNRTLSSEEAAAVAVDTFVAEKLTSNNNNGTDLLTTTLNVYDSLPANSLLYSFGQPMGNANNSSWHYRLSTAHENIKPYLSIDKQTGILTTTFPLRNVTGSHQIVVEILVANGTQRIQHPLIMNILPSSTNKWLHYFNENVFQIELSEQQEQIKSTAELLDVDALGGTFANLTVVELLVDASANGSASASSRHALDVDQNGFIQFNNRTKFNEFSKSDDHFDAFILARNERMGNHTRIAPLHIRVIPPHSQQQDQQQQLFAAASSSAAHILPSLPVIQLPANSPIGTFVLSVEFDGDDDAHTSLLPYSLSQSQLQIRQAAIGSEEDNSLKSFLGVEKRSNSIVVRTNSSLRYFVANNDDNDKTMEFVVLLGSNNRTAELGRFHVQILPIQNCQPHFAMGGRQLNIRIQQENSLFQPQQSAAGSIPSIAQWHPIGAASAAFRHATHNKCDSIRYAVDKVGDVVVEQQQTADAFSGDEQQQQNMGEGVRIDATTGVISINGILLLKNGTQQWREKSHVSLIVSARSGTLTSKIRLQIELIVEPIFNEGQQQSTNDDSFVGPSPLFLEIAEGIPVGTLLSTVRTMRHPGEELLMMPKYRLVGPNTDLFDIGTDSGEIKTLGEIDFEQFVGDSREMPIRMLALAADVDDGRHKSEELEVQIQITDINDNDPVFERVAYDFVVEKTIPIGHTLGRVAAMDADACTEHIIYTLLSCSYHYGSFTRQITPFEQYFLLDSASGTISLASTVDDFPGGHFVLKVMALDDGGRQSSSNATIHIWIVESADIASILINKTPMDLDLQILAEYEKSLSNATSLRPLLHEIRYRPNRDAIDDGSEGVLPHSAVLQQIFLNGSHILPFEQLELLLRDVNINNLLEGMDGFEQNMFLPSSAHQQRSIISQYATGLNSNDNKNGVQQSAQQYLLPLSLLFLFLLATVFSVFGVLICQHRRRFIAKRHLAKAAMAIQQSSTAGGNSNGRVNPMLRMLVDHPELHHPEQQPKYYVANAFFSPPPPSMETFKFPSSILAPPPLLPVVPPHMLALPPAPPLPENNNINNNNSSFYGNAARQQEHNNNNPSDDYYTVQEVKIAL